MSKFKKTRSEHLPSISELDIQLEKIIQFSGWIFLFALMGFMGAWILFDNILNIIKFELSAMTFSIIIFTGINAAISFGLATKIKNNREKKKEFFLDWLLGEFLICMFTIFSVAIYQW
ncbi:hypothetical protein LCGC14_1145060 [marine sediment metagenome]|uniref:Heme-copper oxidase subunit III family profile domain-containing protein n=1 Tax=marine sediment metagenome TaxID=412755 RepID=A0A0F9Q2S7_9ZZZZ